MSQGRIQKQEQMQKKLLRSHIEFEDSEEEAGDTVVSGGIKVGGDRSVEELSSLSSLYLRSFS